MCWKLGMTRVCRFWPVIFSKLVVALAPVSPLHRKWCDALEADWKKLEKRLLSAIRRLPPPFDPDSDQPT